jgi:hypothetical protein
MQSRHTKDAIASLRRRAPDLVVIDANDPMVELRIGEHIFRGQPFALDYDAVPADRRDALQESHVDYMRAMQDLARERFATRLN